MHIPPDGQFVALHTVVLYAGNVFDLKSANEDLLYNGKVDIFKLNIFLI